MVNRVDWVNRVNRVNLVNWTNKVNRVSRVDWVNRVNLVNRINKVNRVNPTRYCWIRWKGTARTSTCSLKKSVNDGSPIDSYFKFAFDIQFFCQHFTFPCEWYLRSGTQLVL